MTARRRRGGQRPLGGARVTAMSWGSRRSVGQAVKFLTDAEIAAGQTGKRRRLTQDPKAPRE